MDTEDVISVIVLLVFGLPIVVPILSYIFNKLIDVIDASHNRAIKKKADYIKEKYENAFKAYMADNHKSRTTIVDEELVKIPINKWIEKEKEAIKLNQEFEDFKLWIQEQNNFSSHCRELRDQIIPNSGCYKYDIVFSNNNFKKNATVWQLFTKEYCLDTTLDYTHHKRFITFTPICEAHKEFETVSFCKDICKFINKLNTEEEVSIYINYDNSWPKTFTLSVTENIKNNLDSEILDRITINTLGNPGGSNLNWRNKINRRIVIIDLCTENEKLKKLCRNIAFLASESKPLILYFSILKCMSSNEMSEIIKNDNEIAEKARKEEEENCDYVDNDEQLRNKVIVQELRQRNETQKVIQHKEPEEPKIVNKRSHVIPVSLELAQKIERQPPIPDASEEEYEKGVIISDNEIIHVTYNLRQCVDKDSYSYYTAPVFNNVVFPYRRRKTGLRGYTELDFENSLRRQFNDDDNYQVLGDVSILPADGYQPYEPDIAIVEKRNKYGLRIDIEIDEPYSGFEKEPIHYIGCGDEFRDNNLANLGWLVIRFSESQIYSEPHECMCYLKHLVSQIDEAFLSSVNGSDPHKVQRWTEFEAKRMILSKEREKTLNHEFGQREIKPITANARMSDFEKLVAAHVNPIIIPTEKKQNIDNSEDIFTQDQDLQFESREHIYIYKGHYQLDAVSNVINKFFKPFDAFRASLEKSSKTGKDQEDLMEEWDYKGQLAREIGTFMHSQIETFFSHGEMKEKTHFVYKGAYIDFDSDISIKKELSQFKEFIKENAIIPFRTEWHICDPEHKIAGTIDLLCRNGNGFDIYDWKRSYKASPYETVFNYGINGLENIPDISFYHYALQQNLYKYMLEKNYNIRVSNMYIVVLHPNNNHYEKYEIPRLDTEIQTVLNYISSKKVAIESADLNDSDAANQGDIQLAYNHEYVDLGLRVKWASCNIGASRPEEYGDHYAWGEIETKRYYNRANYKWACLENNENEYKIITKYCSDTHEGYNNLVDNKNILEREDDVASVKWGGKWHIPTELDFYELTRDCDFKLTQLHGVDGYLVTSKIEGYTNRSIFLPLAGRNNSQEINAGFYWASTKGAYVMREADCLFLGDNVQQSESNRFDGLSVRPVCS